jgi:hypothetical protein
MCSLREPLSYELRSPEIDPTSMLEPRHWSETQGSVEVWIQGKYRQFHQAVSQLTRRRSDLLGAMNAAPTAMSENTLPQGRLLLYSPMETVTCGASAESSRGFFDGEDAPPWDTWFWYSEGTIFSWIPEGLISRAQAGIDANPVECIQWADWRKWSCLTK